MTLHQGCHRGAPWPGLGNRGGFSKEVLHGRSLQGELAWGRQVQEHFREKGDQKKLCLVHQGRHWVLQGGGDPLFPL